MPASPAVSAGSSAPTSMHAQPKGVQQLLLKHPKVEGWDVNIVGQWLSAIDQEGLKALFEASWVDGHILVRLTLDDLKEQIGVPGGKLVSKLWTHLKALRFLNARNDGGRPKSAKRGSSQSKEEMKMEQARAAQVRAAWKMYANPIERPLSARSSSTSRAGPSGRPTSAHGVSTFGRARSASPNSRAMGTFGRPQSARQRSTDGKRKFGLKRSWDAGTFQVSDSELLHWCATNAPLLLEVRQQHGPPPSIPQADPEEMLTLSREAASQAIQVGDFEAALRKWIEVHAYCRILYGDDSVEVARALFHLATSYLRLHRIELAVTRFHEAAQKADDAGPAGLPHKPVMWEGVAVCFTKLGKYPEAQEALDQAFQAAAFAGVEVSPSLLVAKAELLCSQEKFEQGLEALISALEKSTDPGQQSRIKSGLCKIRISQINVLQRMHNDLQPTLSYARKVKSDFTDISSLDSSQLVKLRRLNDDIAEMSAKQEKLLAAMRNAASNVVEWLDGLPEAQAHATRLQIKDLLPVETSE